MTQAAGDTRTAGRKANRQLRHTRSVRQNKKPARAPERQSKEPFGPWPPVDKLVEELDLAPDDWAWTFYH